MKIDELTREQKKYLLSEKRRTGKSMAQCIEDYRMPEITNRVLSPDEPRPVDFTQKDIVMRRRKY